MLAIRLQRTGRRGHAMFRVVVQDARRTPTSGKVVVRLGSYDPHAKTVNLDKEKAAFYLEHGAQPSDSIVRLFKKEGVKLPKWVAKPDEKKKRAVRNPDKRRSTRPEEPEAPAAETETPAGAADEATSDEAGAADEAAPDEPAESAAETAYEEATEEKPSEDTAEKSE